MRDYFDDSSSLIRSVILLSVATGALLAVGGLVYDRALIYAGLGALLPLVPLLVLNVRARRLFRTRVEQKTRRAEEVAGLHESALETLVLAIDAKDRNRGHVVRVQKYARALARAMHLDDASVEGVAAAALLHDIGKLAVPDYILRKRGALTEEEMAKVRLHSEVGAEIISNIRFSFPVSEAVRYHHERYNGSGYPERLAGDAIPLAARILAVVDSYESYMSHHEGLRATADQAMAMLEKEAGVLFDPDIVACWKTVYRETTAPEALEPGASGAYSDIQRAAVEVKSLDMLSEAIVSLGSVRDIALETVRMLEGSIARSTAVFWTVDGDALMSYGDGEDEDRVMPFGAGVAGWVAAEQSPCVNLVVRFGRFEGSRVVSSPVLFDGRTLAVLSVYREAPEFSDDEIRLVRVTADRIAGAVHNARILEITRKDAVSDQLTGLANRCALEKTFERMAGEPFSVVLFDLNDFKTVNDSYGHQTGDGVLARVAQHLRSAFPNADSVCRFGGDEFLVLGRGSLFEMRRGVRQLRRLIAQDPFFEDCRRLGFGVSWGLAAAPDDGATRDAVVAVADRRMYALKARMKRERAQAV